MGEENDDGERAVKATYTGSYVDGKRSGVGKMTFPNGDVYEGEWKDNKVLWQLALVSRSNFHLRRLSAPCRPRCNLLWAAWAACRSRPRRRC